MNGPDLIALKSDDPRQKASTRTIPSSPPAAAVRIPLAGSLRLLSRPKKNPRGLCLAGVSSHWPAACVSAHEAYASPTPPSGAEERPPRPACGPAAVRRRQLPSGAGERPPRPACGTAAVRRGRLKGLRTGRAARAAEGATRPPCAAAHGRQGRVKGLRRAAPPPRPACRAASAHGSITGHRWRRREGAPHPPTIGRLAPDWAGGAAGRGASAARGSGAESAATRTTRPVSAPSPTSHSSPTARWYGGFSSSSCCCFC